MSKYPGADTSKERLRDIEGNFTFNAWSIGRQDVRDLLAMIEERNRRIEYMEATNKARQDVINSDGDEHGF